ncbi:hypothetical protein OpiT1DRAFT_03662 [Opitutaceae bacterium TAV1]|nr:hypothetical protein OpiT1DRAFT_03662 [Opitutaceae bacterium TAV1]
MKIPKTKTTGTLRRALLALGASGALGLALLALAAPAARASTLLASDGAGNDYFGASVSLSGGKALVGASGQNSWTGAVYYYSQTEAVKLLASDGAEQNSFGQSVNLEGDHALVGANGAAGFFGAAYYYKGLDNKAVGSTVTEDVKLRASDGARGFGWSVSLSGDRALAGATRGAENGGQDSETAYYYKGLDNKAVGSTVTEDVKLRASDGADYDYFGESVSLSGDRALVGATRGDGNVAISGAAYYYKGLDGKAAGSTVYEDVKLRASDGADYDHFGRSVSLSGDSALVGAIEGDGNAVNSGSAYYYKGLDGKSGTVEQDVKLLASDGAASDRFGASVSLSGDSALVGAYYGDGNAVNSGAAYYYKGLDGKAVGSTVTQDVKLLASDGAVYNTFGASVSLEGDRFVIGASGAQVNGVATGKAYEGDIRAFTTLNAGGGTILATDGLSFVSQGNWIIGETASNNDVTLSRNATTGIADTANVTATGAAVYIGKTAGAHYNSLFIEGELTANAVYVGTAGNTGNGLILRTTGLVTADEVTIAADNYVGFFLGAAGVNGLVDAATIHFGGMLALGAGEGFAAFAGAEWNLFDFITGSGTFANIDTSFAPLGDGLEWKYDRLYDEGVVYIGTTAVPEPATYAALAGLAILAWAALRRSGNRVTRG